MPLSIKSQVEQAQEILSMLLREGSNLSPEKQDLCAAEVARFAKGIDAIRSMSSRQPENAAPVLPPERLEEERRLGMALKGAHAGIWVWDMEKHISTWSPELRDLLGVGPDSFSSVEKFIDFIHPEDRPGVESYLQKTLQTGSSLYMEFRVIRPDGQILWLSSVGYVEHTPEGRPSMITGINQDISDRKWREIFSLALDDINQIIHSSLDFEVILRETVSAAAQVFGSDTAVLSLRAADGWVVNAAYGFESDIVGSLMNDQEEPHALLAIQTRMPVAIDDASNDERTNREHMRKWGVRSVLVVPVLIRDETIGVIFLNFRHSIFHFQPVHLDFAGKLAAALSLALENARLFDHLKQEIKERERAEQMLHLALSDVSYEKNRLQAMMAALPVGVALCDAQGGVLEANAIYEQIWGGKPPKTRSVDDYVAFKAWWMDSGEPVKPEEWASAQAIMYGKSVVGQYLQIERFDGSRAYVLNSSAPIRSVDGQIVGCAVIIMDITEQKQLENEQREREVQVEIQRRLIEYRELERQEIARDLHDGPIQNLVSIIFALQLIKEALSDRQLEMELEEIALSLKATVRELRDVINELRPPVLLHFGITKAIRLHAEDFCEKHPELELTLELAEDQGKLPEQTGLTLFRIYQEALNNIYRHAGATQALVRFILEEKQVILAIEDNGSGFSMLPDLARQTEKGHFGMAGMKERAEAANGQFMIHSELGKGTQIEVLIPIQPNPGGAAA